jgi:hypothetical protein
MDSVEVELGFRSLRFDANEGYFLNEESFKVRRGVRAKPGGAWGKAGG